MDDLERRIRAARPVSGNRHLPLTDRAKRELAELLMTDAQTSTDPPATPARERRFGMRWLASAATVAIVLVVGGTWWLGGAQPAHAATPPLLVVEPLADSDTDPVAHLSQAARESDFDVPAEGEDVTIRVQSWALHMEEVDGEIDPSLTVISPEVSTTTFRADGSMSKVVTAGRADWESEGPVKQHPPVGTVIWTYDEGPGGYEPLFATSAPRRVDQVEEFLSEGGGLAAGESAHNAFLTIGYLLDEQRLDNLQTAAVLEFVATLSDYTVDGTTTDRLGRSGLVLTTLSADGEYTESLLLDSETGQILASESIYTGTRRTDLTAPALMSYFAWENTP